MIAIRVHRVARQCGKVLVDQGKLKCNGPRIAFIGEQKIGNRVRFEVRQISPAVGEGTVADFQNGFEQNWVRSAFDKRVSQEPRDERDAFDAAANIQESPGLPSRHRVRRQPDKRGQCYDQVVEQFQRASAEGLVTLLFKFPKSHGVDFPKDSPCIRGDGIA